MRDLTVLCANSCAVATAIAGAAFVLYLATLAPTVLWGDDAELQRLAFTGEITATGPRSHPLWVIIGRLFAQLPFGDPAWRANLVSAVFAALAVAFVFGAGWLVTRSIPAAALGSLALAVSHTFWLHAVRAEVYTFYLALLGAIFYLLLLWRGQPDDRLLMTAAFLAGLALLVHPLILTALPGLSFFVWRTPKTQALRAYGLAVFAFALGVLPYLLLIGLGGMNSLGGTGAASLTALASLRPRDLVLWCGFLTYQFLVGLPLGLLGLARLWRTDRVVAGLLGLVFLGDVGFTLTFAAPDQYVFYLPSYLVFALWIGTGVVALGGWLGLERHRIVWVSLGLLLVGLPGLVYRLTPVLLNQAGINVLTVRSLPYRDNNTFFLYPPKNGYWGAYNFGKEVMDTLPPDAAVLADWLPFQTLQYFQSVEGRRPDVLLMEIYAGQGEQVPWLIAQSRSRPVFIAATGRYYDLAEIEREFTVRPFGPIYRLEPIID